MSLIPIGVSVAQAGIQGLLQTAFFQARSIGGFVADVTVEENHMDELRITDHPVERNATISDHAFKLPERVTITVGYSNSSPQAVGDPGYVKDIYTQFLTLQESRQLIFVLTGKRLYQNMLIERLSTSTTEKTENSLMLKVELREIIIVDTQVTTLAPPQDQSKPQTTGGITDQGAVAPQPAVNVNQAAADATFGSSGTFGAGSTTSGTLGTQQFNTGGTVEIPVIVNQAAPANSPSTLGSQVP